MDLSKSGEYFSPSLCRGRVHIVGCGSVGSTVAENLARCGITNFVLWDFDVVEAHNIVNQMFRYKDVGRTKVEALKDILCEINPEIERDIELHPAGWQGEILSGYVFLCADSMKVRQDMVKVHQYVPQVKAMFDFRTRLEDAQHYAADWSNMEQIRTLLASMDFTDEEGLAETPVSACGVTLSVCPTIRTVCAYGVSNFINFLRGKPIKKMILTDAFGFGTVSF